MCVLAMLIAVGITLLVLACGYWVLKRLRKHGYLARAFSMIGLVLLGSIALLYLLPLVVTRPTFRIV